VEAQSRRTQTCNQFGRNQRELFNSPSILVLFLRFLSGISSESVPSLKRNTTHEAAEEKKEEQTFPETEAESSEFACRFILIVP